MPVPGWFSIPAFSGTKVRWILDHTGESGAQAGELAFGTIDSFLIHRLTAGRAHATDTTNASRTLLMNLESGAWDNCASTSSTSHEMLPEIRACGAHLGSPRASQACLTACRFTASWAISKPPCSGRPALLEATRNARTGPGLFSSAM